MHYAEGDMTIFHGMSEELFRQISIFLISHLVWKNQYTENDYCFPHTLKQFRIRKFALLVLKILDMLNILQLNYQHYIFL